MKQTCIQHPPGHYFVVIRDWAVQACDGDTTAAALMSFFEYWHNVKVAYAEQSESANRVARNCGAEETADTSLYQWHTSEGCERGIQGLATKKTISKAVALLIEKGFLSVHKNPDPKKCFDQTKHFLFHPEKVNEWIGQNSPNAAGKNTPSSGKNAQSYKDAHAPHSKDTNKDSRESRAPISQNGKPPTLYEQEKANAKAAATPDALSAAILEVCDIPGEAWQAMTRTQMDNFTKARQFVLSVCGGDIADGAAQVRARFGAKVWTRDKTPWPSQIATEWQKQEPKTARQPDGIPDAKKTREFIAQIAGQDRRAL